MAVNDRRHRLLAALAIACCCAGVRAAPPDGRTEPPRRPNVVLVLADDQTWRDSGAYGNPDVATPNIDRLAEEGMRFTHAFTATAMCAPSRQQLYTGLYPVRSGAYPQNSRVRDGTRSLAHYFRALGYRVGISGKRHYAPEAAFPFESLNVDGDRERPSFERIREFVRRDAREPYLLVVASRQPHTPWNEGEREYAPGDLEVPGDLVDTPETRAALAAYYREVSDFDAELGRVMAIVEEAGDRGDTLFIYTSEQGAMFPNAKWTLYDAGVRTALVVRWPGVVAPGSVSDALVAYVDVVPTLVEAADGDAPAVDGRSFLPVLTGARDSHREFVFGVQTSAGICNGGPYPIRSVRTRSLKLIVNGNWQVPFSNNIVVRNAGGYYASWRARGEAGDADALARYLRYRERPELELYDLAVDPLELENVAGDPRYAADLARLREALAGWQAEQGDADMLATESRALEHLVSAGRAKLETDRCGG